MLPEEAKVVAEYQRRRFNELVDVFDRPQSPEVMVRLAEIVDCAELRPGAVVLNVGNGSRRVDPLYQPSTVWACDVAEKMLQLCTIITPRSAGATPTSDGLWPIIPKAGPSVDQLWATSDPFVESLSTTKQFEAPLKPLGLQVIAYRDEPTLYLMVARKI